MCLLAVILVASASAADLNETDCVSVDDDFDVVEITESDEISSQADDENLQVNNDSDVLGNTYTLYNGDNLGSAIRSASSGDTIILNEGSYYIRDFRIEKSINIIGTKNVVLTTNNAGDKSMFLIGSSVVFKNITFKGGSAQWGNIFYVYSGVLKVDNCIFQNALVSKGGAAIDCFDSSTCRVSNSRFIGITSYDQGGAIYLEKPGELINCTFVNCNAKYGGAISIKSTSSIINCTFIDCSSSHGGAIYTWEGTRGVTISGSTFKSCTSSPGSSGIDMYNVNDISIFNSTFEDCSGEYASVGFYGTVNNINLSGLKFSNIASNKGGGAIRLDNGNAIYLSDSTFINCRSVDESGGAVVVTGNVGNIGIESCNFEECYSNTWGGAIDIYSAENIDVINCNFTNCYNKVNDGGAFSSDTSVNINIQGCNFDSCKSAGFGGSVRIIKSSNAINISDSNFLSSYCNLEGGSVYCNDINNLVMNNCDFLNSSSKLTGGSVAIVNAMDVDLSDLMFKDSDSENYAGSIYLCRVNDCNLCDSEFINSHATMSGGAIHVNPAGDLNITCCSFDNCSSESYGNALDLGFTDNIIIDKSNFKNVNYNNQEPISFIGSDNYEVVDSFFDVAPKDIDIHYVSTLDVNDLSIIYGETGILSVKLYEVRGKLANKYVTLNLNGKSDRRQTDSEGNVEFYINNFVSIVGEYIASFSYDGDQSILPASKNVTVTINSFKGNLSVSQAGKYYEDTSLTFKLVDSITGEPISRANIELTISDKKERLQTDKNGLVTYEVPFVPGSYDFVASVVDKYVDVNTVKSNVLINPINGIIEISQYGRIFKFKLYNSTTGDVFKDIKVDLQFTGVDSESVKTNDEGIANYNFPEAKGTYNLLVSVEGNEYVKFPSSELKNIIINTEYDPSINDAIYSKISFAGPIVFDYLKSGSTTFTIIGGSIGSISVVGHTEADIKVKNNIITVSNLPIGTYTLRVVSNPFDNYYANEATLKITVNKVFAVVKASKLTVVLKKGTLWTVKITDYRTGKPISGLKLALKVYTGSKFKTVSVTTNSKGEASYQTKELSKGTHKVVVTSNQSGYKLNEFTSSITVIKQTKLSFKVKKNIAKDGSSLSITVKKGKKPINGVKIKLLIYTGKKYKTVTLKTKSKGKFKGVCGWGTNKVSAGKHKIVIKPVSIKYSGSKTVNMKLKKSAKKYPAWETKI